MNAFIRFAKAMSEELFIMKAEDLPTTTIYLIQDHTEDSIPAVYAIKIIDDPAHIKAIKERIRMSVLEDVTANPDEYDMCGSDYVYSGNIFDHACLVESYIEEQFLKDHPEFHTVHICSNCNSNNVQVKAWVRPNQNYKYVDAVNAPEEPGFCDDCQQHVMVDTAEVNTQHKVIGFQVVKVGDDTICHPAMSNNLSLYDTMQVDTMMRDKDAPGNWTIRAIWSADIIDPVIMFEGLPQK